MGFQAESRQGCLGQTWRGAHCAKEKKGNRSEPQGEGGVGRGKEAGARTPLSEDMLLRGGQQEAIQLPAPEVTALLPLPVLSPYFSTAQRIE